MIKLFMDGIETQLKGNLYFNPNSQERLLMLKCKASYLKLEGMYQWEMRIG